MEPMTLGSPSGSPAANATYLPSFLMGEQAQATPRNTMLSPIKTGRNISFAHSPAVHSPPDNYNRSALGQKTLFGALSSPTSSAQQQHGTSANYGHNSSISGPPTQGLFDSLRHERTQLPNMTAPHNNNANNSSHREALAAGMPTQFENSLTYGGNNYNDSYLGNNSFNATARSIMSPPMGPSTPNVPMSLVSSGGARTSDFWVTVYGFPSSAAATVLQHFAKCGTIQDKVFPAQNGNWVHIKYSSRLECDKAMNFNEKIIGNIMIGVTQCREKSILDKENLCDNRFPVPSKVRPLAQSPFLSAQNDTSIIASPNTPQRSTGFVNKAMDLIFGW